MKNWKKMPRWLKWIILSISFLILAELILRFALGLGDLAIYRKDTSYEYFFEPNQHVFRFGNLIETNEYGMRSKPVNKKKKIKILEFGDSVLNGGSHVDQNDLTTTQQEKLLNDKFGNDIQILNISAQSWGVSNAFAFLKKHGDFKANAMVLVFSSHDLYDNMHFREVVGVHPAWPNSKPFLAITDAWMKFVWPPVARFFTGENEYSYLDNFDDSKVNPGWNQFIAYCVKNKISLLVYLHASRKEAEAGEYNKNGKQIIQICENRNIPVILDLPYMKSHTQAFIDDVHLNREGHEIITELIVPKLETVIRDINR